MLEKWLLKGHFLEQGDRENLQQCVKRGNEMEPLGNEEYNHKIVNTLSVMVNVSGDWCSDHQQNAV